jgi:tol-pal system protein YbgF
LTRVGRAAPLALTLLWVGLTGCASLGGGSRDADIEELKARVIELQKKAAMAEVEIARLRQEVMAARGAAPPSRPAAPAPPSLPSPPLEVPPSPVPSPIEEGDLEDAAPPPDAPAAAAPTAGAPAQPVSPEAQSVYDQAYTLYHQGRYLDAETAFQRFLQAYGGTELADNAAYWIGECRYARGDLRGALAAFRETLERYPQGNKLSDALLKTGQCYETLGDFDSARAAYDELLARFGDSAAAEVARGRRERLP